MYCPECSGEFRAGIVMCPTCEVALTENPGEEGPEHLQEAGPAPYLIDLVGFVDEGEAKEARRRLREARISCELVIRDAPHEEGSAPPELADEFWIRVAGNVARAAADALSLDRAINEDACPACGKPLEGESTCAGCGYHQKSE